MRQAQSYTEVNQVWNGCTHNLLYKNEYVMRCRYVTDFNMFVIQTESSGQHLVYERDIWIETTDETF